MKDLDYETLRNKCIISYGKIYKDSMAFDMNEVPKDLRIKLLNDPIYLSKTKAARASMYATQIDKLDDIMTASNGLDDKDNSASILKALDMKNKLLFQDLNMEADESNTLNITFVPISREDLEDKYEVHISSSNMEVNELTFPTIKPEVFEEDKEDVNEGVNNTERKSTPVKKGGNNV